MRAFARVALSLALGTLAPAGCTLLRPNVPAGETRVGQGKLYESDNPTYDEFFTGVHEVRKLTIDAGDDEAKARAPLERALGTRSAPSERLVELTKERIKRGREGPPVHVGVTGLDAAKQEEPPAKVVVKVTVPDEAAIPSSQRELVLSLTESAKAEAEIADRFGAVAAKARALLVRHGQLVASVGRDFAVPSRRDEVANELAAAKPILVGVADRADKVASNARAFLKGMSEAFPTGTAVAAVGKEEKGGVAPPHPVSQKSPEASPKSSHAPVAHHPAHPSKPVDGAMPLPKVLPREPPPKQAAEPAPVKAEPAPPPAPPKPAAEDFNP